MRTRILRCKVTGAAVDWLTCTAATPESRDKLWSIGERLLHRSEREGEVPSRWHAHGYSGWCGPHMAVGSRDDGVCLRLSSHQAADEWLHAVRTAENVSRLDLAVDCHLDLPVTSLSRQIYRDAGHVPSVNGRPPGRSLIVNGNGGSTCYIGARSSEQFGRVYDKGVETKTAMAGTWWRWEVELKGRAAWHAADLLARIDNPGVMICAHVNSWFRSRTANAYTAAGYQGTLVGSRQITSIDGKLLWLARSVRPTVQTLVDIVGRDRVLYALGLLPQSAVSPQDRQATSDQEQRCQQSATFSSTPSTKIC